ncbi:mannosyl-oligosaccharide -alpha-mannosidase [Lasius niger]|uniref:Mannosyl-oligosaccharide-alpha-mannosidase n=1 Tax=Lasius niger TaxID=67767 RepID=A0A0J7JXS0_LASNI|nr:mannosyl-oligosaccharide -alpha-mannosidase [Lasius niger]
MRDIGKQRKRSYVGFAGGGGVESWEHVLEEYRDRGEGGCWWERMREILGQEGEGEWWMRGLEKERGVSLEEEKGRQNVGEERERCESDECGVGCVVEPEVIGHKSGYSLCFSN